LADRPVPCGTRTGTASLRFARAVTGMPSYRRLVAQTQIAPENTGQNRLPTLSRPLRMRSESSRSEGGKRSASVQASGVNWFSRKVRLNCPRLYGLPVPKGVFSNRAQTPRRLGTMMISLPPGLRTRQPRRPRPGIHWRFQRVQENEPSEFGRNSHRETGIRRHVKGGLCIYLLLANAPHPA